MDVPQRTWPHPRQCLHGEEGLNLGDRAVVSWQGHPCDNSAMARAADLGHPIGHSSCGGVCNPNTSLSSKRIPGNREIRAGQRRFINPQPGHRESCPKPAPSPHAGGSGLPRQQRTRRFVPTSPRMKHTLCRPPPPPRLSLCPWLEDAQADKGLPGAFSQSPWKAPATPLPSPPPTAHPSHPCPTQPLAPPHRPSTPPLPVCPGRIKRLWVRDERSFSSQSSPPAATTPRPLPSCWSEIEQHRAKGQTDPHVLFPLCLPGGIFQGSASDAGKGSRGCLGTRPSCGGTGGTGTDNPGRGNRVSQLTAPRHWHLLQGPHCTSPPRAHRVPLALVPMARRDAETFGPPGQRGGEVPQTHVSPLNHRGADAPAPPLQGRMDGCGMGVPSPMWCPEPLARGPREPSCPPPQAHREMPAPPGTSRQPLSLVPSPAPSPSPAVGTGTEVVDQLQTVLLNNARIPINISARFQTCDTKLSPNSFFPAQLHLASYF